MLFERLEDPSLAGAVPVPAAAAVGVERPPSLSPSPRLPAPISPPSSSDIIPGSAVDDDVFPPSLATIDVAAVAATVSRGTSLANSPAFTPEERVSNRNDAKPGVAWRGERRAGVSAVIMERSMGVVAPGESRLDILKDSKM